MAFSAIAAIAAAATAATGIAGTAIGSANAQTANATQTAIGRAGVQNSLNQQAYQQALNALALKRSIASTVDGRGDTTVYDPATNTWRTDLSSTGKAIQNATDQASISRNTTDLQTGQDANTLAMKQAIAAREGAGPALAELQDYKPITSQGLEGDLQQTATTANREAQQPIIADTLRQFARTGTAASPVLTDMMRNNATTLRQTMLQDSLAAKQNVGAINNANLAPLINRYAAFTNASKPSLNFSPIQYNSPTDALTQEMATRAAGAAQPASAAAYSSSGSTNAFNNANQFSGLHPGASNLGSSILAGGDILGNLFKSNGAVSNYLNTGGPSTIGGWLGTNKQDGFGNTVGADQLTPNWSNFMNSFTGTGAP